MCSHMMAFLQTAMNIPQVKGISCGELLAGRQAQVTLLTQGLEGPAPPSSSWPGLVPTPQFSDSFVTGALTAACLHGGGGWSSRKGEKGARGSARHSLDGQSLRTAGQGAARTASPGRAAGEAEESRHRYSSSNSARTSASVANMADALPQRRKKSFRSPSLW